MNNAEISTSSFSATRTLFCVLCLQVKSPVQQCKSGAEFLLEPWVLLQMPFQPSLLHQWAVALLAEALTFQLKISPIFSYGCPKKYAYIFKGLRRILNEMKICAQYALDMFMSMCLQGQDTNITVTLHTKMEEFSNYLTIALPIIEFAGSKEANSGIFAIEEILLEVLNGGGKAYPPQVVILDREELPISLYDYWFWTNECDPTEVFSGTMGDRGKGNNDLLRDWPDIKQICDPDCGRCSQLRAQMRALSESWLKYKRLEGVDIEQIMAVVEEHLATDVRLHVGNALHFPGI
jgi:hypothetical protein